MHMAVYVEENIFFFQLGHTDHGFKDKKSRVGDSNAPPMSFCPVLLNASCEVVVWEAKCSRLATRVCCLHNTILGEKVGKMFSISKRCLQLKHNLILIWLMYIFLNDLGLHHSYHEVLFILVYELWMPPHTDVMGSWINLHNMYGTSHSDFNSTRLQYQYFSRPIN